MIRTVTIDKRHHGLWLAVSILLALVAWLAIHWPHSSLWYDEALTAYVATDTWQTLINWCTQVDIQVPFHYIVLRGLTAFAGDSEFTLHLLSALSVLLAVAGMISVGRQITRSKRVGYAAAILLGAMPGILWLGYEVRAYALGLALYAWATAFLCAILNPAKNPLAGRRRWLIVIYALLILATLYTHYTALAGFAAHLAIIGILALIRRSRTLFGALAVIVILVGLGFAPWLPTMLTRGAADRSYYVGGPIPPDRAISVMLGFKLLGREDSPAVAVPLMFGYVALMTAGVLVGVRSRRWPAVLTGILIAALPVILVVVLVYLKPKLAGRYAWPAWIGFDLLAGLFIASLVRWNRAVGVAVLAILIAAPWLTGAIGQPPDSDFRSAYAYLCSHGDPKDVVLLRDGTLSVVDRYYGRRPPCDTPRYAIGLPVTPMTNVEQALTLPVTQAAMKEIASRHPPNVWIVSWQGDVMDPQALAYGLLDGTGNHSLTAKMFGDVRLDRYENPSPITGDPTISGTEQNITPVPGGPTLRAMRLLTPQTVRAGDVIVLQTWWIRGETLQPDLRVSARITALDNGWLYTQVDQPPSSWKYADDRWQPGILVQGRYELTIGPDVPPGKVAMRYLLYDANGRWAPITLVAGEITVDGPQH